MPRSTRRLFLCLAALALSRTVLAQSPFLVKDINADGTQPVSPASQLTGLGTTLFYVYDDGIHGNEIWKSDGTGAGTALLIDLCPGICSSRPGALTVSNGVLFFAANDGLHGAELWKSDGTAEGTVLVKDIRPGRGSSLLPDASPALLGFLDVDGVLFFIADDGESGRELWKSDGTPEGTLLVRDIHPGPNGSDPRPWVAAGGVLLLNADDGTNGRSPWVSDGTTAGTILLGVLSTSGEPSHVGHQDAIAAPGGGFLFQASDGNGAELWKTDGTPAGTVLVKDISPFSSETGPSGFAALGSEVYFSASDGVNGRELWKTDGTEAGTVLVKDVNPGAASSSPSELTPSGGRLFFRASDEIHATELWVSDGTEAGTLLVKDIGPGTFSGLSLPPNAITAFGGGVLFFAEGVQLWRSDGTEAGTVVVPGSRFPVASQFVDDSWAVVDSSFFFSTFGMSFFGTPELYVSDGIQSDLVLAGPPAPPWSLSPDLSPPFVARGDRLLFTADQGNSSSSLWTSDATPAGTDVLVSGGVGGLTPAGDLTFLTFGSELAVTDGTSAGTQVLASSLGPTGSIVALGSSVLYPCGDGFPISTGICRSDGTPGGTGLVTQIPTQDTPLRLTASGSNVFFAAADPSFGRELWKSDGTEAETILVRDIWTGDGDSSPDRLTDVAGTLFFSASTPDEGRELWKTDGTEAGTVLVKDIRPGQGSSIQRESIRRGGFTAAVGNVLFFVADDGTSGSELWKSDGTEAGTVLVKDIAPGSTGSDPFWLTRVGGRVFFSADDGTHGLELWVSDGSEAGTRMVRDIAPGEGSSFPGFLAAVGNVVIFAATDGIHGVEMWRSYGTAAGTQMVHDIAPGPLPSSPFNFTLAGAHVFFGANDGTTGFEPWAVRLSAVLATFADVPADYWAWRFIEAMSASGLTSGCGGDSFCPSSLVTRAEMAVFLLRARHGPAYIAPPATGTRFQDVPPGYWAGAWIEQLAAEGITGGCGGSPPLFCPASPLTRAEMAIFLLLAKHGPGYTPPPVAATRFTDVPPGYWAAAWIEQFAAEGITGGCGGGLYCPDLPVTRAEMAVFLVQTFGLPLP